MPYMPGSFGELDRPHRFYQPPHTPSTSSSVYLSHDNTSSRKRLRREAPQTSLTFDAPTSSIEIGSPAPLAYADYQLAGGVEDLKQLDASDDQEAEAQELDYRPNRHRIPSRRSQNSELALHHPTAGGSAIRKRSYNSGTASTPALTSQTPSNGWSRAVFNVVGKVWDFCWSGAFRGFSAGGGQAYRVETTTPPSVNQNTWSKGHHLDDVFGSRRDSTPIPGQFPDDEGDATQSSRREERKTDLDLKTNWVLVPEAPSPSSRGGSPSHGARKVPRRSGTFISPRRRSSIVPRTGLRTGLNPARPSTMMPPRTSSPTKEMPPRSSSKDSPVAIEAQRYAAKFRRREREEEASIQRLNDQLQAMIREGKEALGSRVEVDELMDLDDDYE